MTTAADVPYPPVEPAPSRIDLGPLVRARRADDLLAVGGDLEPGTVLAAYRSGIFPMGVGEHGAAPMGWWAPRERGVLLPGALLVSRSLRQSCRRYRVSVDLAFADVVQGCADPARGGRWITEDILAAYTTLHGLGWAHSVEVWRGEPGDSPLVGGVYGLSIGGLFAGESMFHRARDASKVALVALTGLALPPGEPDRLLDVQWLTPHLASLGARAVPRFGYRALLRRALTQPQLDLARAPLPAPWSSPADRG